MMLAGGPPRFLALGLLAVATLALYEFAALPLIALYAAREEKISLLAARTSRIHEPGAGQSAGQLAISALARSDLTNAIFWPGATESVAAAGLQQKLRVLLQDADVGIESAETLPSSSQDGARRIGVKLRFAADIDQIAQIVRGAEALRPALVVDRLAVQPLNSTRPDAAALSVELQVIGLADLALGAGAGK